MRSSPIRLTLLGLGVALLSACGARGGPSDADVAKVLMGSTHMMIGHGYAHSGFFKTDKVSGVEHGEKRTINGIEVFPVRVTLGGSGKTGEFTYLFYKNDFGEWTAEEQG